MGGTNEWWKIPLEGECMVLLASRSELTWTSLPSDQWRLPISAASEALGWRDLFFGSLSKILHDVRNSTWGAGK